MIRKLFKPGGLYKILNYFLSWEFSILVDKLTVTLWIPQLALPNKCPVAYDW